MAKVKLYTSYAWMHRKWAVERLSEDEIAKQANTTQMTINNWLHKHNLKKRR